ncbi:MAG: hypothetical protein ABI569_07175 [Casimicrobiaceae bacterium]
MGIALASAVVLSACGGGSSGNDAQSGSAAGTLDPGFGSGGAVLTSNSSVAHGIALQPDGKIVVAAGNSVFRYTPNGVLDATFGTGGAVSGALGTGEFASFRVALQPDGLIVAAGSFTRTAGGGAYHCALVRYMADGATDRGFGDDGMVVWDPNGNVSACTDVALQPDRQIVVGVQPGSVPLLGGLTARFRSDGTPDPTFGVNGSVYGGGSIALQPDLKILAAWILRGHGLDECDLGRVDAAGVSDPGFGNGGSVQWKGPFDDQAPLACAMARQPDGKIVVVNEGSVARFLDNGTLDPGFGTGGVVTGIPGVAVAVQSNGKIVVAGGAGNISPPNGFALWRLGVDGRLDPGFGIAGSVTTSLLDKGGAEAVAIQSDGKILAAGWAESRPAGGTPAPSTAALARYFGD